MKRSALGQYMSEGTAAAAAISSSGGGGRTGIWAELKGDIELHRKLKRFAPKLRKRFVLRALRNAARPILTAARAEAPRDTVAMAKALYLRKLRVRDRNMMIMTVRTAASQHKRRGLRWYGG